MGRLLFFVSSIFVLCTGSILAVMIGGGRLNPDWTPYFDHIDVCGNELCILGVVPGITHRLEGENLLKIHADEIWPDDYNKYHSLRIGNTWIQMGFRAYENYNDIAKIDSISFNFTHVYGHGMDMPLGVIVARFGSPCDAFASRENPSGIDLSYPFGYVDIEMQVNAGATTESTKITMDTKVTRLDAEVLDTNRCSRPISRWLGFRSWNDYVRIEQTQYAASNP